MFQKILQTVENTFFYISLGALLFMVGFVMVDVIGRYVFNAPVPCSVEFLEEYILILLYFPSIAYVSRGQGHVRVELFINHLPAGFKRVTSRIMSSIAAIVWGVVAVLLLQETIRAVNLHIVTKSILRYPMAPAYAVAAVGTAIVFLELIFEIFREPKADS